jgi:transposase-like protein
VAQLPPEYAVKELQKLGVEQFLEAEMDENLGYEKSQISDNHNARNGNSSKKIKSHWKN